MTEQEQKPNGVKLPEEGGQAFPCPSVIRGENEWIQEQGDIGMTLRQWFAGHAMQGLVNGIHAYKELEARDYGAIASLAYDLADAMLAHETKAVERWRADRKKITPPQESPLE